MCQQNQLKRYQKTDRVLVKTKTILKWTFTTLWVALGAGVLVLLVAAIKKEESQKCAGLNIVIKGVSNNFFVDKNDIIWSMRRTAKLRVKDTTMWLYMACARRYVHSRVTTPDFQTDLS